MEALLVLADGTVLRGEGFGARGTAIGEVVFNTGMTGYQEVITDPSYTGQLITFTYPELGNTGVNHEDLEADAPAVKAVITRELAPLPSNWRCSDTLEAWLERHGVVGLRGIDTRAVVRLLREGGAINGAVSTDGTPAAELLQRVRSAPSMEGQNLAAQVSTSKPYRWTIDKAPLAKVASGGELSRLLLAFKTVLAGGSAVVTSVFDEVDAGVSGAAAEAVGVRL